MNNSSFLILILSGFLFMVSCAKDYNSLTDLEKKVGSTTEQNFDNKDRSQAYYHFTLSQIYFYRMQFADSLNELKEAENLDPGSSLIKYHLGVLYLLLNSNDLAVTKLEEAIKLNPRNPLPYKALGRLFTNYESDEIKKRGKKLLKKAIKIDPKDHELYLFLAINSIITSDIENAKEYLDKSLTFYTEDARVYFYLGSIAREKKDLYTAFDLYKQSLTYQPSYYPALISLADVAEELNSEQEAINYFERAISDFPYSIDVFISYGNMLYKMKMLDEALIQYENAEVLDTTNLQIKYRIGLVHLENKQYEKSIEKLNKILSEKPDHDGSKYYLALNYIDLENYTIASSLLKQILPGSDFYDNAVVQRAVIHEKNNDDDKALNILEAEYKGNPDNQILVNFLGSFYKKLNRIDDTIDLYKNFLQRHPKDEVVRYSLGVAYYHDDQIVKSINAMNKITEINPSHADAINFIGYTYAERGERLDYAEKLIRKALKIEPNSGYIIDSLGWVYYQKGDFENALKYLTKAVQLAPDDPSIIEHLGDAYHKKGNKSLAVKNYNRALEILYSDKELKAELNDLEQRLKEKVKEIQLNEV